MRKISILYSLILYYSINLNIIKKLEENLRDISLLIAEQVYTINKIYTFDFFPNTMHTECLAFLSLTDVI